jgi:hypothetical protein
MTAKLTRLIHKIAFQLHLVAESCNICSFRSRQKVRKLLDTLSYAMLAYFAYIQRRFLKCRGYDRVKYKQNDHEIATYTNSDGSLSVCSEITNL